MADKVPGIKATSKKTGKVPAATKGGSAASTGGTPYHQAKLGKGFIAVPPKDGHKQRRNIK